MILVIDIGSDEDAVEWFGDMVLWGIRLSCIWFRGFRVVVYFSREGGFYYSFI